MHLYFEWWRFCLYEYAIYSIVYSYFILLNSYTSLFAKLNIINEDDAIER